MARTSPIGGIYGRPIGLGNFFHFAVMAVALVKAAIADQHAYSVLGAAAAYSVFAVWFGVVVFVAPKPGSAT
jgi:hypothetical protein